MNVALLVKLVWHMINQHDKSLINIALGEPFGITPVPMGPLGGFLVGQGQEPNLYEWIKHQLSGEASFGGAWLCGFNGVIGVTDSFHFELQALWMGSLLAWDEGWRRLICQSDCLEGIKLIKDQVHHFHVYRLLVLNIKDFLV
ncbi:hypothetical protein RJT34_32014 [Clitoria ternatea]|uniref:RNase H type-1 domain-containing protein n=1 Tax=Clitoria ternatea TaxID=43366 RepID=A0AAN9EZI3_CLITE